MTKTKKILLTLGGILIVTALAFGAWLAASPIQGVLAQEPTPTPEAGKGPLGAYQDLFLEAFAKRLGVTLEKIKEAFSGAFSDALRQAVKDGALTQEQADEMQSRFSERLNRGDLPGFFPPFGRPGGFAPGGRGFYGFDLSVLAEVLGLSEDGLKSELQSGKSIADIAAEKNVDLAQVKAKVLEATKAQLDQAVQDGKLTQTQAEEMYSRLESGFDTFAHQTMPLGIDRPGRHGRGGFKLSLFAEALGMNEAELMNALREGKTIATIATDKGIDLSTLKASVLEAAKTKAEEMVNWLESNFDTLVNQTLPMGVPMPKP